jgi:hypothetical protein
LEGLAKFWYGNIHVSDWRHARTRRRNWRRSAVLTCKRARTLRRLIEKYAQRPPGSVAAAPVAHRGGKVRYQLNMP